MNNIHTMQHSGHLRYAICTIRHFHVKVTVAISLVGRLARYGHMSARRLPPSIYCRTARSHRNGMK
jgi:hypothetical protein